MARSNKEVRLHIVCMHYLLWMLPKAAADTLIHIPNGENRTEATGALLKRMGTRPGAEDLQFCWQGRLHAIEIKCEGSYQSPAQKARQAALEAAEGHYAVARSIEDVAEILAEWAIPTRDCSVRSFRPDAEAANA